jgi:hydrogenase-4 component E
MNTLVDGVLVLLLVTHLALLGLSRLGLCIRVVAFQGIAMGLMPLLLPEHGIAFRTVLLVIASVALKGVVFPWFLFSTLRSANVRREIEPFVGYSVSLLAGALALGVSLWLAPHLTPPVALRSPLILPTALFTLLIGLFLIVTRKKALMQVVGYLVLENGIYLFGVTLAREQPLTIELGILLDVFVAVFVMGIAIFHISREFDHIDVDQLTVLKD